MMENRTPDNLFYDNQTLVDNGGNVRPPFGQVKCAKDPNTAITLKPWQLDACFDPRHGHGSWKNMYHQDTDSQHRFSS